MPPLSCIVVMSTREELAFFTLVPPQFAPAVVLAKVNVSCAFPVFVIVILYTRWLLAPTEDVLSVLVLARETLQATVAAGTNVFDLLALLSTYSVTWCFLPRSILARHVV